MSLDLRAFEVLSFDCYGTLIDWEAGILAALRRIVDAPDDALLAAYARHEAALEAGPYMRYRDVLAGTARAVAADLGHDADPDQCEAFAASVGDWPPFPDSAGALAELRRRYRLAVITNCDDDLFSLSQRRLGVDFDWVVTAQQAGGYKPNASVFAFALDAIGAERGRVLHVAQSLYHDHLPAKALGLSTVWVDRRRGRAGHGATPTADATPDLVVPDLASLAELAV